MKDKYHELINCKPVRLTVLILGKMFFINFKTYKNSFLNLNLYFVTCFLRYFVNFQ
jgi:hypothetical protein